MRPRAESAARTTTETAASACQAHGDCNACTAATGCRWCTEPSGCEAEGSACTGLLLAHANTCENDPIERTRLYGERDAARAKGLTAVGAPVVGHLESFPGVDFDIARGLCYAIIVRFGKGARLGDVTRSDRMDTREESSTGGSSLAQPSAKDAPSNLSCPRSPGKLTVWYEDRWSRARVTKAGTGEISVQLYSYPIGEKDLQHGTEKSAAIDEKIRRMPADCDDCDFDCRSSGTACEHRCFVDTAGGSRADRGDCEYGCAQITRACQDSCASRCR